MKKRIVYSLVSVLLVSVMLFTGCGGTTPAPAASGTAESQATTPSESAATSAEPSAVAALAPYKITILTAGDMPVDQQLVLDEVAKRTKDTLNITLDVKYFPWADYIEKNKMMAAAGDKFDIFLNFSFDILPAYTRKQAIKLDDLMRDYGQDIKASISEIDWGAAVANGDTIAIPAIYPKDSVYNTAIVRKDLREKYNLAPITNLETCAAFLEAIAKNEPNIIPSVSGGMTYLAPRNAKLA